MARPKYKRCSYDYAIDEGPCEFCGISFPLELLIDHETACEPDLVQLATKVIVEGPCEFCNISLPLHQLIEHQSSCQPDLLHFSESVIGEGPCEFCGVCFSFEYLIEHQTGCRPDLLHFFEKYAKEPIHQLKESEAQLMLCGKTKRLGRNISSESNEEAKVAISNVSDDDSEECLEESLEAKVDICDISDDDSEECLEEFWKRGYILLNQRKVYDA